MPYNQLEDPIAKVDLDAIKTIIASHPESLKSSTSFHVSPLVLSCYYGNQKVTDLLMQLVSEMDFFEACAANKFEEVAHHIYKNPNIVSEYYDNGYTGLGLAAHFGNDEIARYLVLKGADVNLPSDNAFRVLPIHSAVAGNFTNLAKMLIANHAHVNVPQYTGITPLHSAAQNGNIELIIPLLEHGASVDARTEGGKRPADLARDNGFMEIAEILA